MSDNDLTKTILKAAFTIGLLLHILSIIMRVYLIIYGPIQFLSLLPYMLMEGIFLMKSIHAIYVTSSKNGTTWLKTFSIINVFLIMLLFIASILFEFLLKENSKSGGRPPTFNVAKVVCIIFLSGPLITNSAFLGCAYLSTNTKVKEVADIICSYTCKDIQSCKISNSSL